MHSVFVLGWHCFLKTSSFHPKINTLRSNNGYGRENVTLKETFAPGYIFCNYCFQLQVIARHLHSLLLLWLVGVITLALVFRQSFETCSIRPVLHYGYQPVEPPRSRLAGTGVFSPDNRKCVVILSVKMILSVMSATWAYVALGNFSCKSVAILLRLKLHEKLLSVTHAATGIPWNIFVAATVARSRNEFYFSQRVSQHGNKFFNCCLV